MSLLSGNLELGFLLIRSVGLSGSGKTEIFSVESVQNKTVLGFIKWFGAWRKYVFYVESGMVFDDKCLIDLERVLVMINAEHKRIKETLI